MAEIKIEPQHQADFMLKGNVVIVKICCPDAASARQCYEGLVKAAETKYVKIELNL